MTEPESEPGTEGERPGRWLALTSVASSGLALAFSVLMGLCLPFTAGVSAVLMPVGLIGFLVGLLTGRAALKKEGLDPRDDRMAKLGSAIALGAFAILGVSIALVAVLAGGTAIVMYGLRFLGVIQF